VNGDQSPLNLSLMGPSKLPPVFPGDVTDEEPEETRRRKAELMTSLRLTDSSSSASGGRGLNSPEMEMATDWGDEHLLYEPPISKLPRTADDEAEEKTDSDDGEKKGMTSLLGVLAVCSFTDVYNSYQRRLARRTQPSTPANIAAATTDYSAATGNSLSAEVDYHVVEADRKSLTESCTAPPLDVELSSTAATSVDNGLYPLTARCVY